MAKQKPMHIAQFERRLDQSDELIKDLIVAIQGDDKLGIKGAIPLLKEVTPKVDEALDKVDRLERRIETFEQSKGVIAIKTSTILTRGLQIIGGLGILASVIVAIMQLIDWLKKEGLLTLLTEQIF
jgi:hypothetical protein